LSEDIGLERSTHLELFLLLDAEHFVDPLESYGFCVCVVEVIEAASNQSQSRFVEFLDYNRLDILG